MTQGGSDERPAGRPTARRSPSSRRSRHGAGLHDSVDGGADRRSHPFPPARTTNCGRQTETGSRSSRAYIPIAPTMPATAHATAAKDNSKVKAHIAEKLLYRHWTCMVGRQAQPSIRRRGPGGAPRDLTPGADYDVPPFNLDGAEAIAFSPDSQELCFTANTDKDEATSTNGDLFTVPVTGATRAEAHHHESRRRLGAGLFARWKIDRLSRAASGRVRKRPLAPDALRPRQRRQSMNLTENFDRNVNSPEWSADSKTIYFQTEDKAEMPIYSIAVSGETALRKSSLAIAPIPISTSAATATRSPSRARI